MAQLFKPRIELVVKIIIFCVVVAPLLVVLGGYVYRLSWETPPGVALAQPIPFSHKHHVGDDGIDCRFCHAAVEKAAFPGMPSANVCLTCHSQLFADQPMFAPLRASAASGKPIAWAQLHRLPDFVYFDHSVHVAKGVACIECHGRVDQMPIMKRVEPLSMRWCMSCHSDPAPHLRPPDQVFSMHPDAIDDKQVRSLARLLQIESQQRMTDCSTCHR
jgi:hypothetical protein